MKRQTHSNQAPRDSRPPPRWWDMRCAVFTPLFLALSIVLALAAPFAHAADKVAICYGAVSSALVPLAKQRDFYTAEGLDMDVHLFPSGRQALEAMLADDHVKAREVLHRFDETAGPLQGLTVPVAGFRLSSCEVGVSAPPQTAGAQNQEILGGLGYTSADIEALKAGGVI